MLRGRRFWVSLAMGAICLLLGADQVAFKTAKARDAKVAFDEAMKKALTDYNDKALAAMKSYRLRLEQAKGIVMKTGDLEEANRIASVMKKVDQEMKETAPDAPRALLITKASFGFGDRWADVTDTFRERISNDVITDLDRLPDPWGGKDKTVIIEGMYGGRPFIITFNDSAPRRTFSFGDPLQDVKIFR